MGQPDGVPNLATETDLADFPDGDAEAFDARAAARICWYYFKEGQTQEAIAQRLGLTRKRVNRAIADALARGLVQIGIDDRYGPCIELEVRLAERFGLRRAIVVPSPAADFDVRMIVGAAAGQYINGRLGPNETLGITWGGTIHAAAQNIRRRLNNANQVVSLSGGLPVSGPINPYDNAAMVARSLGAVCRYVTAPMIADSAATRDALVGSSAIRSVLDAARDVDVALFSAVDLSDASRALEYGVITKDECASLRDAGCVGDIAGQYLGRDGAPIDHPFVGRVVAPALGDLLGIKEIVLAAGGVQKVELILAGIRSGLCHVLITDEHAAAGLLRP
jgi:DNA-binding transcriptional regulator LsrR (DeoR family)